GRRDIGGLREEPLGEGGAPAPPLARLGGIGRVHRGPPARRSADAKSGARVASGADRARREDAPGSPTAPRRRHHSRPPPHANRPTAVPAINGTSSGPRDAAAPAVTAALPIGRLSA